MLFFVARAAFAAVGVSRFVAGAADVGAFGVPLLVAGAAFEEIWVDSRSAKCYNNFHYKMHLRSAKTNLAGAR